MLLVQLWLHKVSHSTLLVDPQFLSTYMSCMRRGRAPRCGNSPNSKPLGTASASTLLRLFLLQLLASLLFLVITSNMTCFLIDFFNGLWWLIYNTSMIVIEYIYRDMDDVEDKMEVCCETILASLFCWYCWLPEAGEYVKDPYVKEFEGCTCSNMLSVSASFSLVELNKSGNDSVIEITYNQDKDLCSESTKEEVQIYNDSYEALLHTSQVLDSEIEDSLVVQSNPCYKMLSNKSVQEKVHEESDNQCKCADRPQQTSPFNVYSLLDGTILPAKDWGLVHALKIEERKEEDKKEKQKLKTALYTVGKHYTLMTSKTEIQACIDRKKHIKKKLYSKAREPQRGYKMFRKRQGCQRPECFDAASQVCSR